jgi:leishmanolysin
LGLVFGHASIDQIIQKHYVHTEGLEQESEPQIPPVHKCSHDEEVVPLLHKPGAFGHAFERLDHQLPKRQATSGPLRFKWVTTYFDSDVRACTSVGQSVNIATNNQPFTCTADDVVTPEVKDFINTRMIPAISEVFSSFLSVPYLNGNMVFGSPATCTTDVSLPSEYLTTGVPNTDYVVMATIRPTASASTVAYAGPCKFLSSTGRPVAGFVNFNPRFFNDLAKGSSSFKFAGTVKIRVHEMTHAMGFTSSLYDNYRNANGQVYNPAGTVTVTGTSAAGQSFNEQLSIMKGPAVLQTIRDHYNCQTLPGALLEDFGGQGTAGSHWEQRIVGDEYMGGYVNPTMPISALTLALFQDMGWYTVNISKQEYWGWGKGLGCAFADRCEKSWPSVRGAWCAASSDDEICTLDRSAKGSCTVNTYSNDLEPYY